MWTAYRLDPALNTSTIKRGVGLDVKKLIKVVTFKILAVTIYSEKLIVSQCRPILERITARI